MIHWTWVRKESPSNIVCSESQWPHGVLGVRPSCGQSALLYRAKTALPPTQTHLLQNEIRESLLFTVVICHSFLNMFKSMEETNEQTPVHFQSVLLFKSLYCKFLTLYSEVILRKLKGEFGDNATNIGNIMKLWFSKFIIINRYNFLLI